MDDIDDNFSSISSNSELTTEQQIYIHLFDKNEALLHDTNGKFITEFQYEKAREIYNKCNNTKILTLIVAETQMGKTGILQALTREFVEKDNIRPKNILILTGLSSSEWVSQTQNRFIGEIRNNIFHRNMISKLQDILQTGRELIIFLDEVHIANELKNNIGKIFIACGLLNISNLIERQIRIIQISATPDAALTELYKWDETNFNVFVITSPDNYIGIEKLLHNGQINEYKSLVDIYNVREIKTLIESKYGSNYKYHLIRIHTNVKDNTIITENIDIIFRNSASVFTYNIQNYCTTNDKKFDTDSDLNGTYLNRKPTKHTIIILKEKVRCSYTIIKNHIGVLYERKATNEQNEMTIIQGLVGRACGYYDNTNRDIIVFTNIEIITNYIKKIKMDHDKTLYEIIKKNKKNINDKNVNYNSNDSNNDNDKPKIKLPIFNIRILDVNGIIDDLIDEKKLRKSEVYIKPVFDKLLKQHKLYEYYTNYEYHLKFTFKPKQHTKLLSAIDNKSFFHYNDIYNIGSVQDTEIKKRKNLVITGVNKYQTEVYLIFYDSI